jgi:hypothetical protein
LYTPRGRRKGLAFEKHVISMGYWFRLKGTRIALIGFR